MSLLTSVLALSLLMGAPADGQPVPTRPAKHEESKAQASTPDNELPQGRVIIGLAWPRASRLRVGGEWTRTKPFFVQFPLGDFLFLRWDIYQPPVRGRTSG